MIVLVGLLGKVFGPIGFAFAAWKPHRAFGLLPFTAALVATTLVSLVADIVSGTRTLLAELIHLAEIVGLTLLWMIAGSPGWRSSCRTTRTTRDTGKAGDTRTPATSTRAS